MRYNFNKIGRAFKWVAGLAFELSLMVLFSIMFLYTCFEVSL